MEVAWFREVLERTLKDTAAGELTPNLIPQLANGTGPNRARAQWKFTKASGDSFEIGDGRILIYSSIGV